VPRRLRLIAATPFLLSGLASCGAGALSADEIATKAEDALEDQVGARPEITCPDDLAAEVGAKTECTLTSGGDPTEYGVKITVTEVDGDNATFDVQVDEEPKA
jgi:hypothetical protein